MLLWTGDDIWNSVYLKSGSTFSRFVTAEELDSSGVHKTSSVHETSAAQEPKNPERRYPSLSRVTLFDGRLYCEKSTFISKYYVLCTSLEQSVDFMLNEILENDSIVLKSEWWYMYLFLWLLELVNTF